MSWRRVLSHRHLSSSSKSYKWVESTSTEHLKTQQALKALMVEMAQPVAIVTTRLKPKSIGHLHGATISSLSSIAMDPHPLVAFSLKHPSRLADALRHAFESNDKNTTIPHFVINILSSKQAKLATMFSRPDLHPNPFKSTSLHFTSEGQPAFVRSMGRLLCAVSSTIPLPPAQDSLRAPGSSELFIARVLRVETPKPHRRKSRVSTMRPLVYHKRKFGTIKQLTPRLFASSRLHKSI